MLTIEEIMKLPPYSLDRTSKQQVYKDRLSELMKHHYEHCEPYRKLLNNFAKDIAASYEVEEHVFLPVRLFKDYELCSVPREEVVKTMTSSGTTGQKVSKIFLDKQTAMNQTKVLTKITSDFLGPKRLPMLIIDSKNVVKDRKMFSARGAGILGFSMLGYDVTYALDENMKLDIEAIKAFLKKHEDKDVFVFGFTFIIWEHFYKELSKYPGELDLSRGIMLHGGGFKKLIEEAVDNISFKEKLQQVCSIQRVYNYYGMVEQTGSIFMECECGRLHASNFSDIIVRDPKDFSVSPVGKQGVIQLVSLLPQSYPGHSLLSEDVGEITGEDDCPCGRKGKTFKIYGRIKNAEVRGCSDTYERR